MSRWAVAVIAAALVLTSGCASAGGAPAANTAIDPPISKRASGWEGRRYQAPHVDQGCGQVRDLTASHGAAGPVPVRGPAVQVAPDCSPLDAEPFAPGPVLPPTAGRV